MNKTFPWKIGTIVLAFVTSCLLLLLILSYSSFRQTTVSDIQKNTATPSSSQQPAKTNGTPENQVVSNPIEPESFQYPSSSFFLASGTATVGSPTGTTLANQSFLLTLQPHGENAMPKSYSIPISNTDYVVEPKISYNEKYGCIQVGSSGYWGYYIFSLPGGEKVDQGEQYSNCVEWISDYQVIIAEQPYNTANIIYSILDVRTKQKQVISSFSN